MLRRAFECCNFKEPIWLAKVLDSTCFALNGSLLFILSCCILTVDTSTDSSQDDQDASEECKLCKTKKPNLQRVKDLSPELVAKIQSNNPPELELSSDDQICQTDIARFNLMKDLSDNTRSDNHGRWHDAHCGLCENSLLLDGAETSTLVSETEGLQDISMMAEFKLHRHFTNKDGLIPPDKEGFARYARRIETKKKKSILLGSCFCKKCFLLLERKYNYAEKGIYYTPKVRKKKVPAEQSQCVVKDCNNEAIKSMEVVPSFFESLFNIETQCSETVPTCVIHYNKYRNAAFGNYRCFICTQFLRKAHSAKKFKPNKDLRQKLVAQIDEKALNVEVPDDFQESNLEVHKNCWNRLSKRIQRAEPRIMDTPKKRPNEDNVEVGQRGKRVRLSFADYERNMGPSSSTNIPDESEDEIEEEDLSDVDLDETEKFVECDIDPEQRRLNVQEIINQADEDIVAYINEHLQENMFITRKEVVERWNNIIRTLAFQENYDPITLPSLKAMVIQERIMNKWIETFGETTAQLQMSLLSTKRGVLIHYQTTNLNEYQATVDRMLKKRRYEDETDEINWKDLIDTYRRIMSSIDVCAKKINDFYSPDNAYVNPDYNIRTLFSLFDPLLFNFIVFITLSERELVKLLKSEHLITYLTGKQYCLETYNPSEQRSHTTFVRRVFLCLELIYCKVRGRLVNPLSLQISDIVNKYSGSVPLVHALNTLGVTYSDTQYKRIRAQLITQDSSLDERFPLPDINPRLFNYLSIDNYDANKPYSDSPGIHVLGTGLNVPNKVRNLSLYHRAMLHDIFIYYSTECFDAKLNVRPMWPSQTSLIISSKHSRKDGT